MKAISKKQRIYANARMAGKGKTDAARIAGYSENGIHQSAQKLDSAEAVVRHYERHGFDPHKPASGINPLKLPQTTEISKAKDIMATRDSSADALDYLASVMLDEGQDAKLRIDAAKFLVKRVDDQAANKTQAEKRTENAAVSAQKFATSAPPLRVIK